MGEFKFNRDCKSFPGRWACDIMTAEGYMSCKECKFYEPVKKVLIIKYGAAGDILRTTPILSTIREKYGDVQIYWLTNGTYDYNRKEWSALDCGSNTRSACVWGRELFARALRARRRSAPCRYASCLGPRAAK